MPKPLQPRPKRQAPQPKVLLVLRIRAGYLRPSIANSAKAASFRMLPLRLLRAPLRKQMESMARARANEEKKGGKKPGVCALPLIPMITPVTALGLLDGVGVVLVTKLRKPSQRRPRRKLRQRHEQQSLIGNNAYAHFPTEP